MLLRNLDSVLVARGPALADCGEVATMVDSALFISWDDGERRTLGVSCLLRSGSVPVVCIRLPALCNFAA